MRFEVRPRQTAVEGFIAVVKELNLKKLKQALGPSPQWPRTGWQWGAAAG